MNKPSTLSSKNVTPNRVKTPSGKLRTKQIIQNENIKAIDPTIDTLDENLVQIDMTTHKVELSAAGDFENQAINISGNYLSEIAESTDSIYTLSSSVFDENYITPAEKKWIVVDKFNPNIEFNTVELDLDNVHIEYPMANSQKTSTYGMRGRGWHSGLDLSAVQGEPIVAVMGGIVRLAKFYGGYGNVVVVKHDNGIETIYAHNYKNIGKPGMKVGAGDVIALCGNTGRSTGNHLHFEVRVKGVSFDPEIIFNVATKDKHLGKIVIQKVNTEKKLTITRNNQYNKVLAMKKTQFDNPYLYPDYSKVGNYVASAGAGGQYYTITSGDTLSQIAVRYRTTVRNICALNNMSPKSTLKINKKIRIK